MSEKDFEAFVERFNGVIDMVGYLDGIADMTTDKVAAEIIRKHAREGEVAVRELMEWVAELYQKVPK